MRVRMQLPERQTSAHGGRAGPIQPTNQPRPGPKARPGAEGDLIGLVLRLSRLYVLAVVLVRLPAPPVRAPRDARPPQFEEKRR